MSHALQMADVCCWHVRWLRALLQYQLQPFLPPVLLPPAYPPLLLQLHHHASAAAHWLSKAQIDPNDPRNAALLELLKAREAAAHGGGRGADSSAPGLFRWVRGPCTSMQQRCTL